MRRGASSLLTCASRISQSLKCCCTRDRSRLVRSAGASISRAVRLPRRSIGSRSAVSWRGPHKQAMDRAAHGLSKTERGTLIELLKKLGTTAERQLTEGERNHDDHPDS